MGRLFTIHMKRITEEDIKKYQDKFGFGYEQAKNVIKYDRIRDNIKTCNLLKPENMQEILLDMLRFCAPNECTGPDCSCHKQKADESIEAPEFDTQD